MELQEIEIIRRALDTEVSHKEYVKNVTKAKNILNKYETLQASQDKSKLLLADVSNLLPLDNCIVEWEKFIKQHNLKGNAGVMSVYFGIFLHGWRGRNSEGFWQ